MIRWNRLAILALTLLASPAITCGQDTFSWRYYRTGNTGIQGDWNGAIYVGPDGDPWIGGYSPSWEEGGFAKFVQAENRWINFSNIDYPVIGHPDDVGTSRVSDIIADGQGNLWLGTWRGMLKFTPSVGGGSIVKYSGQNSPLPGGLTRDMTLAPDGTVWISAESTTWGGGGLTRYNPATNTWTNFNGHGGGKIAAQAKPSGGYYLWSSIGGTNGMTRWNSSTGAWTSFPFAAGQPAALVSLDSVDDAGNVWMMRWVGTQGQQTLDCMRPDGTWITPPLPPLHPQVPVAALRAFGTLQAIFVDGFGHLQRFDGRSWTDLGPIPSSGFIDDLEVAADGTIWLCGSSEGGAFRRDGATGQWQRYRITNTSQFDSFNNDLTIDPATGNVFACANAGTGIGGMVQFDGTRWTGFNQYTYGLGFDWPFDTDNSEAVCVRPTAGGVAVNPTSHFSFGFDGSSWTPISGGPDQIAQYAEDSLGRLWGVGHYGSLGLFTEGGFTQVDAAGWGLRLEADPDRPGTVWANEDWKIIRTDGAYRFSRTTDDFPELLFESPFFNGLAVDHDGIAWVGVRLLDDAFQPAGGLMRIDATAGTYTMVTSSGGWPFPGDHVYPHCVTPDGKLWLSYEGGQFPDYLFGLCWWDGINVGTFPAPSGGEPQWGGLPHASIKDLEVKLVPGGYELWMSCLSRGLAVLTVRYPTPGDLDGDGSVGASDLAILLGAWGSCTSSCPADLDGDGAVGAGDLAILLGAWS